MFIRNAQFIQGTTPIALLSNFIPVRHFRQFHSQPSAAHTAQPTTFTISTMQPLHAFVIRTKKKCVSNAMRPFRCTLYLFPFYLFIYSRGAINILFSSRSFVCFRFGMRETKTQINLLRFDKSIWIELGRQPVHCFIGSRR